MRPGVASRGLPLECRKISEECPVDTLAVKLALICSGLPRVTSAAGAFSQALAEFMRVSDPCVENCVSPNSNAEKPGTKEGQEPRVVVDVKATNPNQSSNSTEQNELQDVDATGGFRFAWLAFLVGGCCVLLFILHVARQLPRQSRAQS